MSCPWGPRGTGHREVALRRACPAVVVEDTVPMLVRAEERGQDRVRWPWPEWVSEGQRLIRRARAAVLLCERIRGRFHSGGAYVQRVDRALANGYVSSVWLQVCSAEPQRRTR